MSKTKNIISQDFNSRFNSMLRVDSRRMLTTPNFWIMLGTSFVLPILILVMTTMAGGTTVTDPTTGVTTTMEAFKNTWQIIGSESGAGMSMDMTAMCNINLVYFLLGIFICLFISEDFSSGYAKNLFTVRAKKTDYVASKTVIGFVTGAAFLIAFFAGSIFGGSFAGLSFELGAAGVPGLVMSMIAKIFLMAVFSAIAVLVSCYGKQRSWLSMLIFLFGGMLLFMVIPMMTPLDAGLMHVIMCLAGGVIFSVGIGFASNKLLTATDLI